MLDGGQALVAVTALPDLAVVDVDASGLATNATLARHVRAREARVRNQSVTTVGAPFEVAFFEDRDGDGMLGAADAVLGRVTLGGLGPLETRLVEAAVSGSLSFLGSPVRAVRRLDVRRGGVRRDQQRRPRRCRVSGAAAGAALHASREMGVDDGERPLDARRERSGWRRRRRRGVRGHGKRLRHDGRAAPRSSWTNGPGALLRASIPRTISTPRPAPRSATSTATAGPEIVAVAEQGQQLLAFEHDGTFKWRSATLEFAVGAGAPFLADLDGDGRQEIVDRPPGPERQRHA